MNHLTSRYVLSRPGVAQDGKNYSDAFTFCTSREDFCFRVFLCVCVCMWTGHVSSKFLWILWLKHTSSHLLLIRSLSHQHCVCFAVVTCFYCNPVDIFLFICTYDLATLAIFVHEFICVSSVSEPTLCTHLLTFFSIRITSEFCFQVVLYYSSYSVK